MSKIGSCGPFPLNKPTKSQNGTTIRIRSEGKNGITIFEKKNVPAVLYGRFKEMKARYGGTNYSIFEHWVDFAPMYSMLLPEHWKLISDEAVRKGVQPSEVVRLILYEYCKILAKQVKNKERKANKCLK